MRKLLTGALDAATRRRLRGWLWLTAAYLLLVYLALRLGPVRVLGAGQVTDIGSS